MLGAQHIKAHCVVDWSDERAGMLELHQQFTRPCAFQTVCSGRQSAVIRHAQFKSHRLGSLDAVTCTVVYVWGAVLGAPLRLRCMCRADAQSAQAPRQVVAYFVTDLSRVFIPSIFLDGACPLLPSCSV